MGNSENPSLLAESSILMVRNKIGIFKCFRILVEYIFLMLLFNNFVLLIFPRIYAVFQTEAAAENIGTTIDLLSRLFGLVAAGYFAISMTRKYFPAPTISLSLSQIGLVRCSKMSASFAVILGVVFSIIFEFFLPNRYPADPSVLEKMSSQFGNVSSWTKLSLVFVTVGVVPIVEEVFFRGFLYRAFSDRLGIVISALVVTVIFILLHYQVFSYWVAFVSLMVGSVTLILIREISGSLIPPILLHQFYNLGVATFQ